MEFFVIEQEFFEYINFFLYFKKYFLYFYQGSVFEFENNFLVFGIELYKVVQIVQGLYRLFKFFLGYRYGFSVGQLIERINKKVEVSEFDIIEGNCEIRFSIFQLVENLNTLIIDIKILLLVETDNISESKSSEEVFDSIVMIIEGVLKKERRWVFGIRNFC